MQNLAAPLTCATILAVVAIPLNGTAFAQDPAEVAWTTPLISSLAVSYGDDIAVDADGSFFVTAGMTPFDDDRTLGKLDRDGALVWEHQWHSGPARLRYVDADGVGGVYGGGSAEAGSSLGGAHLGGESDGLLVRYRPDGAVFWSRRIGGNGRDKILGVATAPSGGCFVVGSTTSSASFGGGQYGFPDSFVARFDALGNQLWVQRTGRSGTGEGFFRVRVSAGGDVICSGDGYDTNVGIYRHVLIARLSDAGTWLFLKRDAGSLTSAIGCAPDGVGGAVLTGHANFSGYDTVVRLNPNGDLLWERTLPPAPGADYTARDVLPLAGGTFAVVGYQNINSLDQPVITEFSASGTRLSDVNPSISDLPSGQLIKLGSNGRGTILALGRARFGTWPQVVMVTRLSFGGVGTAGCVGAMNSTGIGADLDVLGSDVRSHESMTVFASDLPTNAAGYFLTSTQAGFVAGAGGSQGDLCLGGAIGRFNRAGEVLNSGPHGRFHLDLDLDSLPSPTGTVPAVVGETRWFQAWYRDMNPAATSNFTSSTSVTFQ